MKYKDYYEILGVKKDADAATIKSAYRKLARKYHPDVNKAADAQAKFKDINEAYEVLGDSQKRQRYDQLGSSWAGGADFTPPPGFENFSFSNFGSMGGNSGGFSDFFSAIFGDIMNQQTSSTSQRGFSNFGDFSQFTQNTRNTSRTQKTQQPKKEENLDIIQNVVLDINDLINCPQKTITVSTYQQCKVCHGLKQGFCSNCMGTGIEKVTKNITFKVPKFVKNGQKIRLKGEGKVDSYGNKGDVYLIVNIKDKNYEIDDYNLIVNVELLPYEAVLGCEKTIKTPEGNIKIKIPKNTSTDKKLRLKNLGLIKKDNSRGDLEAKIRIILNENMPQKAIELYEELKKINS